MPVVMRGNAPLLDRGRRGAADRPFPPDSQRRGSPFALIAEPWQELERSRPGTPWSEVDGDRDSPEPDEPQTTSPGNPMSPRRDARVWPRLDGRVRAASRGQPPGAPWQHGRPPVPGSAPASGGRWLGRRPVADQGTSLVRPIPRSGSLPRWRAESNRFRTKGASMSDETSSSGSPTIVLVHGAFADASSWNGVIERLQARGLNASSPLPTRSGDRERFRLHRGLLDQIDGPGDAVGHSYGARSSRTRRPARRTSSASSTSGLPDRGRRDALTMSRRARRTASSARPSCSHVPDRGRRPRRPSSSIDPAKLREAFAGRPPRPSRSR